MAFDLLFQRETDTNWARGPVPAPMQLEFSPAERRALKLLEPSTAAHVIEVIGWARSKGIPAKLYEHVLYTPAEAAKFYQEGKSGIREGRLDWHQVGRAYHLIIIDPVTKQKDVPAYARVAEFARSRGGEWLGDKVVVTPRGPIQDLAHYEYHPGLVLWQYRKSPLAIRELAQAEKRAARYG